MTDPINYTSTTPRFALPFLFAGQAQKEIFVNEALARIDGLLQPAIEGEIDTPPVSPQDGQSWIVGSNPSGAWLGHAGQIACRQAGNWLFCPAPLGMIVYDKSAGQQAVFNQTWNRAQTVAAPAGGTTIDVEARAAIAGLIAALASTEILP